MSDSLYGPNITGDFNGGVSLSFLEKFATDKEGRNIGMIYENEVPKISFDVEAAVREMRSNATGGQIIT
jgi:hypothetical protein